MYDKFEQLGASIMLRGIKENELLEKWDYKKGKDFSDVRAAVVKGKKKGLGKFENEAMYIGFALERVLKLKAHESTESPSVAAAETGIGGSYE
jgi:hypothetical protein